MYKMRYSGKNKTLHSNINCDLNMSVHQNNQDTKEQHAQMKYNKIKPYKLKMVGDICKSVSKAESEFHSKLKAKA